MKAIKALFISRLLREKILILCLLLLGAGIWVFSYAGRGKDLYQRYRSTSEDLTVQAMWLGREVAIQENAKKAITQLDPAKSLNSVKLNAEIKNIANEAGLGSSVQIDDFRDQTLNQFAVHSLRFTVRKANYPALVKFYTEVQKRSPYIGLGCWDLKEQFTLQADPSPNPATTTLTAMMRLTSVEVVK
jgi:hypothetical protein